MKAGVLVALAAFAVEANIVVVVKDGSQKDEGPFHSWQDPMSITITQHADHHRRGDGHRGNGRRRADDSLRPHHQRDIQRHAGDAVSGFSDDGGGQIGGGARSGERGSQGGAAQKSSSPQGHPLQGSSYKGSGPPGGGPPGGGQRGALSGLKAAGLQGGIQPGLQGGTQPGLQGGTQPGLQGGTQPGLQGGTQPGLQGGTQPGLQGGTQPGLQGGTQQGREPEGSAAPGAGLQGSGLQQGSELPGSALHGTVALGSGLQGSGLQGSGHQGSGLQGSGLQGSGHQGSGLQGSGLQGSELQGSGLQHGSAAQGSGLQGGVPQAVGLHSEAFQVSGMQAGGPQRAVLQGADLQAATPQSMSPRGSGLHQDIRLEGAGAQGVAPLERANSGAVPEADADTVPDSGRLRPQANGPRPGASGAGRGLLGDALVEGGGPGTGQQLQQPGLRGGVAGEAQRSPLAAAPPGAGVQRTAAVGGDPAPAPAPDAPLESTPSPGAGAGDALGVHLVLSSMHRNLPSQAEAFGNILASLRYQHLGRTSRPIAQSFVSRLLVTARSVLGDFEPGALLSGPWAFQLPPGGRLLEVWDTASIALLATQGEMAGIRGPPSEAAAAILQAFADMSAGTPEEARLLRRLSTDQLMAVLGNATLGLEGSTKEEPHESAANLADLVLTVCGVRMPRAALPQVRADVAALALTLYECVADNDRLPASRAKVEMVNRLLVQRYHAPATVSTTGRVTNAELLAHVLQRMPEAAQARFFDTAGGPSPSSPNPDVVQNRKMREWRTTDLCTELVLRMVGTVQQTPRHRTINILIKALA